MKVKVIFYSMYGHTYRLAEAVAEGAREVKGAEVELLQVAELVPEAILEQSGAKQARAAFAHIPIAKVDDLADADALIFGTPTRFGNMCSQMRNFLDQTGPLWAWVPLSAKLEACSLPLAPSMAVRRPQSQASIARSCTTGWLLSGCRTLRRGRRPWMRSAVAVPMARRRSLGRMAAACPARTSWQLPVSRAAT